MVCFYGFQCNSSAVCESLKGFFLWFTDCLTIGIIHETMVVHMTWVWTFFNNYIYIYIYILRVVWIIVLINDDVEYHPTHAWYSLTFTRWIYVYIYIYILRVVWIIVLINGDVEYHPSHAWYSLTLLTFTRWITRNITIYSKLTKQRKRIYRLFLVSKIIW